MEVRTLPFRALNETLAKRLALLFRQLSQAGPPDLAGLRAVVRQSGVTMFVAWDGDWPVGCLTLVTFTLPTGLRAWIEDVVVDTAMRGQGIGQELVQEALEHCRSIGVRNVDLTSRPERKEANRLYKRCGFEQRKTNVWRYTF